MRAEERGGKELEKFDNSIQPRGSGEKAGGEKKKKGKI